MDWNNINTNKDTSGLGPIEYDQSKVPSLIRKHADNVRGKSYGQQVRESQARNAEYAGLIASKAENVANNADLLSKDTQSRFKDQIEGTTNSDEVIDARRPYGSNNAFTTLNDRLEYERKIKIQVSLNIMDMVGDPNTVDDWIPVINEAMKKASELGGVSVFFPAFEYIVKPTQTNYIEIYNGVNLIGGNNSVIKVSDNNPDFFYLMTGKDGRLVGCTIEGLTFDTNAANQTSNVSMDNKKKRIIFRVQTASDLRFINNKFLYSGVNAIITHGAMYNHKNNIIAHNYFKFTNQSDTTYDNTACYIGQIGHQIVNNIFESTTEANGITARTAIETHSSYGVVDGNIINNYMYCVLVLGVDYANDNPLKDITPKVISNNIMMNCLGGVLMWSSEGDVKHVVVNGNTIYINNATRGRYAEGYYGIALDHNTGGLKSRYSVSEVSISGNNIKFEISNDWLTSGLAQNSVGYDFEGAFAIGARTSLNNNFNLSNISVLNNTIEHSPRMPFSFVNFGNGIYSNIIVSGNDLLNSVNQRMIPIKLKSAIYLEGAIENIAFLNNNYSDNRETPYIAMEIGLPTNVSTISRLTVRGNTFNQRIGVTGLASILPPVQKGQNWNTPRDTHRAYANADALKGQSFEWNDIITLALKVDNNNTFLVTSAGTVKDDSLAGSWSFESNILKVPTSIDIRTIYPNNYIKITKADGSSLIGSTKIIGVDYVNREVMISNTNSYIGAVNVSYSKPSTSNTILNGIL